MEKNDSSHSRRVGLTKADITMMRGSGVTKRKRAFTPRRAQVRSVLANLKSSTKPGNESSEKLERFAVSKTREIVVQAPGYGWMYENGKGLAGGRMLHCCACDDWFKPTDDNHRTNPSDEVTCSDCIRKLFEWRGGKLVAIGGPTQEDLNGR